MIGEAAALGSAALWATSTVAIKDVTARLGAFYIMADVSSTGMSGDAFAEALLREERVAVAPGVGFAIQPDVGPDGIPSAMPHASGAPAYPSNPKANQRVRIAFCVSDEELREGLTRMVRFVDRVRANRGVKAGA